MILDTKEAYLAWRKDWRYKYNYLSECIRLMRQDLKRHLRASGISAARGCQQDLRAWSRDARIMLVQRAESKAGVRRRLRELGFNAPDPKVRQKPAPRPKVKPTAEQLQAWRNNGVTPSPKAAMISPDEVQTSRHTSGLSQPQSVAAAS